MSDKNSSGNKKGLSAPAIAFMYMAMVMGAGFSSGRESWQYFGVFGSKGYLGALLAAAGFMLFGSMFSYIARSKGTDDLGSLISPWDNKIITGIIGYTLAIIYYTIIMSMSAAGGALLKQQFGIDRRVGGAVIVILVLFTVMGNYERMAGVFNKLVPVLFIVSMTTVFIVILSPSITQSGATEGYRPGAMSPNWFISAIVFTAYNSLGMITTSGSCALRARDKRAAFAGPLIGTGLLGLMIVLLLTALLKDMAFSATLDLPMLAYAGRLSLPLSIVYAVVLYGSIYATASSTFYGFSTKLPEGRYKRPVQVIAAFAGYVIGLTGYKFLVEYLYPPQGYIGFVFLTLVVINFFKELHKNKNIS